jgi:hypothetical protein
MSHDRMTPPAALGFYGAGCCSVRSQTFRTAVQISPQSAREESTDNLFRADALSGFDQIR